MNLIRFNEPTNLFNDWDAFFADPFRAFVPLFRSTPSTEQRPAGGVEWYEDDDAYHARVEMPGVKREELGVDAEDGLIRLSFQRADESESEESRSSRSERFEQVLRSPDGVDTDGIRARLADGILQLDLPKADEKKSVTVEIE